MNFAKLFGHFIVLGIVLMLLQVVCNKVLLFGVAMPVVYIYLLLRLPITLHTNWALTCAFLLGLLVDTFNDTPGMHTLACLMMMAARRPVFNACMTRDDDISDPRPSGQSMGGLNYLRYMAMLVVIYCAVLFLIQAFSLHDFLATLSRIAASSLLSIVLLYSIDSLVTTRREKRL